MLLLTTALSTASIVVFSLAEPAAAQANARSFNIAPQPLASALREFANQSGMQLAYRTTELSGMNSPGFHGSASNTQALARLLAGTGVSYNVSGANTVTIQRAAAPVGGAAPAGAISLDTIDVQGETAWGPVNGFVASRSATATKTDTPIIEVPQSISVVTRDQIETRRNQTLNETLQYTPGVLAERTGQQQFAPRFQVRGFSADGFNGAIYLNGLRSATNWSDIEPYGLERIEVMRGPASVLYGQGVFRRGIRTLFSG
ncbi:TonB-dependent receptor plug domain-containing protein [Nitrobacter sp.]|uniref:STN domain-containing protein n=1 Tax=Nitrobacter sp. TaxID=29420 RepID=UPI00322082C9